MKIKSIILVGIGFTAGFISCGVFVAKKVLESKRMVQALKQAITDKITYLLWGDCQYKRPYHVDYASYDKRRWNEDE